MRLWGTGPALLLAWLLVLGTPALSGPPEEPAGGGAPPGDQVLHWLRSGLSALREDRREVAKSSLDLALERIDAMYADSEAAARARSLWYDEGSKDYLGEPYERAAAFLYRGILHLQDGELDDARACFRGGMLQDAFAEEEQHRCDFALLVYLYGMASLALGDPVGLEDAFQEAGALMPRLNLRVRTKTRYLVLVETGMAPRKITDGLGHGQLKYARGRGFQEAAAQVSRGGVRRDPQMYEDLYYQASTRGGRGVDKIIEGKVIFQADAVAVGRALDGASDAAQLVGVAQGGTGALRAAGGLSILGGVAQLIAARVKPRADARAWDNLPDQILAFELPGSAAEKPYRLIYQDHLGRDLPRRDRTLAVPPAGSCPLQIVFVPSPSFAKGGAEP